MLALELLTLNPPGTEGAVASPITPLGAESAVADPPAAVKPPELVAPPLPAVVPFPPDPIDVEPFELSTSDTRRSA